MAKNLVSGCIKLAANLSPEIKTATYLPMLSDIACNNYAVFQKFACASKNSMLAILFKLGHFGGDRELLRIAADIISIRAAFDHEEEDVGEHVADLMEEYRRIVSGKYSN